MSEIITDPDAHALVQALTPLERASIAHHLNTGLEVDLAYVTVMKKGLNGVDLHAFQRQLLQCLKDQASSQ